MSGSMTRDKKTVNHAGRFEINAQIPLNTASMLVDAAPAA